MNFANRFISTATWTHDRQGVAAADSRAPAIEFSSPPASVDQTDVWTPEHLCMAAVAACFVATFRSNAEFSQFEALGLEVTAEGSVERADGGLRFMRVILRPVLSVAPGADREHGLRLLERAGRSCVISRSLRSQIILEPKVRVSETVLARPVDRYPATPQAAP